MDFFKNRNKIAFWSALVLASIEIARQFALGDYPETGSATADFIAVFACAWLIWRFNFLVDDYQERKHGFVSHRSTSFRLGLSFLIGAVIVLVVESVVHRFFREAGSNLLFYFLRGLFHNMVILVIYFAMQAQRKKQQIEVENAALKEENVLAQLDLLRQQVQPHFLFNALNTLKSMVKGNDPKASDFIMHLSGVYRYLLQSTMKQQTTISEELEMLNSYAYLLKTRFSDNFNLDIQLPAQVLNSKMPPLTFQLLMENAVKHNVVSMDKPLHIQIYCPDDGHVAMRNNLQPKKAMEESNGAGLKNVNRRYELLAGQGIEVSKTDQYFEVKLPTISAKGH
ncbi:MAG: histidine kinase [Saprospiraceae bacterium]|nr:histidine kinase [Saprospiraceae bacterium]